MEAGNAPVSSAAPRVPLWIVGLLPLVILGVAIGLFIALGAPGLDRNGIPVEELSVERTVLRPGEIQLHVRNDGPDAVKIRQVTVNDAFTSFRQTTDEIGRLHGDTVTVAYPWIEGEAYDVGLVTATGGTITHAIDSAAETPGADLSFYGLMALIGLYVGIIPVGIGMLWLPWVRRIDKRWVQFLLAATIGLLGFLGVDALIEGADFAGSGSQVFGGALLVYAGAAFSYLGLMGVDARLRAGKAAGPWRLALLVALGIGLHNLGEGLAIGSAYAIGSLALGASLVVGFALHNTTEGLAIVAPVAEDESGAGGSPLRRLAWLGVLAGAPAILGAWIGASAFNPSLAALLFGLGAGAITQVIVQIAPSIRDATGRLLNPLAVAGILTGLVFMYATSLLVAL